jgi:hypothetical protein
VKDPIATVSSQTASLTVAIFDAATRSAWVHSKAAENKAQFTGHPAEIMRGLGKGEDIVAVDVGASAGFAFELEGQSGKLEIYEVDGGFALAAPPRAWWAEHHSDHTTENAALFDDIDNVDGEDLGELELASGKLAIAYLWDKNVPDNAIVIDASPGAYQLKKRTIEAPWGASLVVMYVVTSD